MSKTSWQQGEGACRNAPGLLPAPEGESPFQHIEGLILLLMEVQWWFQPRCILVLLESKGTVRLLALMVANAPRNQIALPSP